MKRYQDKKKYSLSAQQRPSDKDVSFEDSGSSASETSAILSSGSEGKKNRKKSRPHQKQRHAEKKRMRATEIQNNSREEAIVHPQGAGSFIIPDNRPAIQPKIFDIKDGGSLTKFFERFEQYCSSEYRSTQSAWLPELEKYLKGVALDAFLTIQSSDDTYSNVKARMLSYFKQYESSAANRQRKEFRLAKMTEGENKSLYAVRLEKLFKLAHPKEDVEKSMVLLEKFLETTTKRIQESLWLKVCIDRMEGIHTPWSKVKTMVSNLLLMDEKLKSSDKWGEEPDSYAQVTSIPVYEVRTPKVYKGPVHPKAEARPQQAKYVQKTPKGNNRSPGNNFNHRSQSSSSDYSPGRHGQSTPWRKSSQPSNRKQPGYYQNQRTPNTPNRRHGSYNNDRRPRQNQTQWRTTERVISCSFCKKRGHGYDYCWKRLDRCLSCGSNNHFAAECPKRHNRPRPHRSTSSGQRQVSGATGTQRNNSTNREYQRTNVREESLSPRPQRSQRTPRSNRPRSASASNRSTTSRDSRNDQHLN